MSKPPIIICLMGPTASGKTELAIELYEQFPIDIISVDSAMIYKTMNIGTAKPAPKILQHYPHQLIDIRDPKQTYSASEFRTDALAAIENSLAAKRIPLLTGGTMLYFRALISGLSQQLPASNPTIRKQIESTATSKGWSFIHQQLSQLDSESAQRIHINDKQRLSRALEVCLITGKKFSELRTPEGKGWTNHLASENSNFAFSELPYRILQYALIPEDRQQLHQNIAIRFKEMLASGLIEEVEALYKRGDLNPNLPSIRCVGYRQVWDYLDKMINRQEMQDKGIIATRQLAKHQLTWLRSWKCLHQFTAYDKNLGNTLTRHIQSYLAN